MIRLGGLVSGLDTDAIVKELMSAQAMKKTKVQQKKTKEEWKLDKWKDLNKKLVALYNGRVTKLKMSGAYRAMKVTSSNESAVKATATSSASTGSHTVEVKQLASSQFVTGAEVEGLAAGTKLVDAGLTEGTVLTVQSGDKTQTFEVTAETTVGDFTKFLSGAGLNASFDEKRGRFFLSSKESGVENSFTLTSSQGGELEKLGLGEITEDVAAGSAPAPGGVSVVTARDAVIVLDGAEITDSSNSVTVAGLTLDLVDVTDGPVKLNTTVDTEQIYKNVKEFLKEYNSILDEMNKLYNAASARGYEPLSDEEKEAMSEEDVKLWEDKIKDSLLRRDDTLGSLTQAMRNAMQESVEIDGKKYNLGSLGIHTSTDYTENGLLHIYGDEDDSTYAGQENQLQAMLSEDPEIVEKVMSAAVSKLSDVMFDKMKSIPNVSSAMTFYHDKEIQNNIDDYEKQLKEWDQKLQDMEDRYYKQFSAMEQAMSKLNSQSSYLSQLMGGGQ